jgi:hemerythrin
MNAYSLPWTAAAALSDPELDAEHRTLLDDINRLLVAVSSGDQTSVLMSFSVLVAESRRHFAAEEALMRKLRFPDIDRHRAQHEKLQLGLAGLQFTLSNRPGFAHSAGPFVYLDRWFGAHLQSDDRRLAEFVHRRDGDAHPRPTLRIVGSPTPSDAPCGSAPAPPPAQ